MYKGISKDVQGYILRCTREYPEMYKRKSYYVQGNIPRSRKNKVESDRHNGDQFRASKELIEHYKGKV